METLGKHYIAEFYGCNRTSIDDIDRIENILLKAVEISNATMIKPFFHKFSPQGVTGVILIAESHLSIHTWPERGYAAVDLFSCGDFNYKETFDHIEREIESEKSFISVIQRGLIHDREDDFSPIKLDEIK
ncbi:adenosylmethionine decarboxylase [Spirochaetota bacterium]